MKIRLRYLGLRCTARVLVLLSMSSPAAALPRVPAIATAPATEPLYSGVRIEHVWIPMSDGVRLAANLFLPEGAKPGERFPAILEYLPYRKDDWTALRDYGLHSYFVRRGYVTARVDIRGTGASEGIQPDREYSDQEQLDGMEVIAWLARQPWSNGNVGMMGISWGGFNSIQMAMHRPPALKTIIAVDATDELFHDDIHYIDGLMHLDEFELSMDLFNALTRAPDFPTDDKSLGASFDRPPWFLLYLHQQRDGPFWRRASLRPDYARINIPVYLIGGFLDGYRDSIPRMMQNMKTLVRGLVGTWNHTFPHDTDIGPAIEWREDATRWWDRWLKGRENGIEKEPRLTYFLRRSYAPNLNLKEIPGEWRTEDDWPPRDVKTETLFLTEDHSLSASAGGEIMHELKYLPSAGVETGFWWGDLTDDQRPSDAYSQVYDSPPLGDDTAILGWPRALLRVSSSAPLANWFVRLCDVAPDGASTQVTGAGQSGAQRDSSTNPKPIDTGQVFPLEFDLHFTSWIFPKGNRIRVAISNAAWPMIWPTPYPMITTLKLGGGEASAITLPVLSSSQPHRFNFSPPAPDPELPGYSSAGEPFPGGYSVTRDPVHGTTQLDWGGNQQQKFPWGEEDTLEELHYSVADAAPAAITIRGKADIFCKLSGRTVDWRVELEVRSDATNFYYSFTRTLVENGKLLRTKSWTDTIPRDFQ